MWSALLAATVQTLVLDGAVPMTGSDYELVTFEVPAGIAEIEVAHAAETEGAVLDFGLWGPGGFRGWGGGLEDDAIVGESGASRGYLPGPITEGTWTVVVGKAKMPGVVDMALTVTLRDQATIEADERGDCSARSLPGGAGWYAGDFHVHSSESGDASASLGQIAELATDRGLDFVMVTDHNTVSNRGLICARDDADVLLLPGVEITTYAGHGNAFGIDEYVDHRVGIDGRTGADIVGDVVAQGGIFMVNHPKLQLGSACIGCGWEHEVPWDRVSAIEIQTGDFDITGTTFTPAAVDMWDQLLDQGYRITALGGSDDHRAGTASGSGVAGTIGSPTTVLWLDQLSEQGVVEAVAGGRAIVKLRGPDDPDVELVAEHDGEIAEIGGTIAAPRASLRATVLGGDGYQLQLIEDGEVVESVTLDDDEQSVRWSRRIADGGNRYRIQLAHQGDVVVVSNHVYVDHSPGAEQGGCSVGAGAAGAPGLGAVLLALLALARRRL